MSSFVSLCTFEEDGTNPSVHSMSTLRCYVAAGGSVCWSHHLQSLGGDKRASIQSNRLALPFTITSFYLLLRAYTHTGFFTDALVHVYSYVILDTPGQIEIFTWSASGAIITDAVASSFPTVVAYIIDTPRTTAPATFMSNMLYACR